MVKADDEKVKLSDALALAYLASTRSARGRFNDFSMLTVSDDCEHNCYEDIRSRLGPISAAQSSRIIIRGSTPRRNSRWLVGVFLVVK